MALRCRKIENFDDISLAAWSRGLPICVSSASFQKSSIGWPQQPPTEKVLKFIMIFCDSTQTFSFRNIQIKLNLMTWMTLKSSVVIFQALELLRPQWSQWPLQPHFIKNITYCDGWIIPGTKMTNIGPFLWNGSSKINFFFYISTISVRGCWGQPMLIFWKLVDETQMPTTPEATSHHSLRKFSILLPLRNIMNHSFHYETPCMLYGI